MTKPYVVKLPNDLTLVVELDDRPVDFEIALPGGSGKIVFSRVASNDTSVKGVITLIQPTGPPVWTGPVDAIVPSGALKRKRIHKVGDPLMSIEYSDPEMNTER